MYQPNKQLREILVACVKSEHLQQVIERLVESVFVYINDDGLFSITPKESVTGKYINIEVDKTNFDEVLECGKWYPREKFDGNPNDYLLVEFDMNDVCGLQYIVSHKGSDLHNLLATANKFMYIKKP